MFSEQFDPYACMGDTITCRVQGFEVVARIVHDQDADPPWQNGDGHGPVTDWTTRPKAPGERVLSEDRGSRRYYDAEAATRIAKRDGWDAPPLGEGTPGERAARAVEADYQALRAWCNDEWWYCGVVLSVSRNGITLDDHAASLWGVEANYPGSDNSYLADVANELLDEAIEAGHAAVDCVCCIAEEG